MDTPYPPQCVRGHQLTKQTAYVPPDGRKWRCRLCLAECTRKYRAAKRHAKVAGGYVPYDPARRVVRATCRNGHPWIAANVYGDAAVPGKRQCKACRALRLRAQRRRGTIEMLHQTDEPQGFVEPL